MVRSIRDRLSGTRASSLDSGGAQAALAFLDDARQRAQRTGIEALPDFLGYLEIEYRARGGNVAGAGGLAADLGLDARTNAAGVLAGALGWREWEAALQAAIRLEIARRDWEKALAFAKQLVQICQSGGRLRAEIKGHIFCALVQNACRLREAAIGSS